MSALEKLISIADGTTDESMHVCVPVSLIRELQAWNPGEKERLTTNGAKAWAGVDPQSLRDEPEHVQRAAMDALIREAAVDSAIMELHRSCAMRPFGRYETPTRAPMKSRADRAIRILRHFGLLVERGDGVVSIRDNDEAHRRDAAGGPSGGADCSAA